MTRAESLHGIIEERFERRDFRFFNRFLVVEECESTQDVAKKACMGCPGVVIVAARQTAGRGRLGRSWADTSHLGLPMTFVIESGSVSPGGVSILAGVAACVTCELALGLIASDSSARGCVVPLEWQSPSHTRPIGTEVPLASIGLRWPNDVVELRDDRTPGRKLAGVLIEQSENLLFVGIGINVLHDPSDWPPELADKAISLRALGSRWSREDVARQLIASVDTLLSMPSSSVETYWGERNALCGHKRTFIHNGVRTTGKVVGIDPVNQILLRLDDGTMRALPALSTSLLHDE